MLPGLRYSRFWLVFGWCSVVAALILSVIPSSSPVLPEWNDKFEHVAGYFLLTFFFCGIYPRQHYWIVALAMLSFGALVEILQGLMHMGRNADMKDLIADAVGIAPAILLSLTPLSQWPRWIERAFARA